MTRVLVVEDDATCRYTTKKALTDAGFEVVSAANYLRALEAICGDKPIDIMVTDIVMPNGVNGFALARMAKMRLADLKILYMTAFDVPPGEALGKILRKPVDDKALVDEVCNLLAA